MNKILLISATFLLSISLNAQVTIGSASAPIKGALLDLKDGTADPGNLGVTASKGLGLPRVKLEGKNILTVSTATLPADQPTENKAHIGTLVYNTKEIEKNDSRLCKGLHVWNGSSWKPLTPYPNFANAAPPEVVGTPTIEIIHKPLNDPAKPLVHMGYIEDIRGTLGDGEYNRYAYARIYNDSIISITTTNYKGQDKNACSTKMTTWTEVTRPGIIAEGVWMTENMNSIYFPDNTLINGGIANATSSDDLPMFSYPALSIPETSSKAKYWDTSNGILYNWPAAVNRGTGPGQTPVPGDVNETNIDHEIRQGICPTGWHVPSDKEWTQFEGSLTPKASANTRATIIRSATRIAGITVSPFGESKTADMGGFNAFPLGSPSSGATHPNYNYGIVGYYITSSIKNTQYLNNRVLNSDGRITNGGGDQKAMHSVRCKRDDL